MLHFRRIFSETVFRQVQAHFIHLPMVVSISKPFFVGAPSAVFLSLLYNISYEHTFKILFSVKQYI